jgi:hypothetical protein
MNAKIEKQIEDLFVIVDRLHTQLMDLNRRYEQLEFAVTNGISAMPKNKSAAAVERAKGNPGGVGGDFV